jgi:hypothetical protein
MVYSGEKGWNDVGFLKEVGFIHDGVRTNIGLTTQTNSLKTCGCKISPTFPRVFQFFSGFFSFSLGFQLFWGFSVILGNF